jgi:high-affinity Fe2+/Pb2+ permease
VDLNTVAQKEPLRNHDAVKLIGWIIAGYAWRVAVSLLQIIFVLYIFSHIEFDTIVIAISGLVYVVILSIDLYFIQKQIDRAVSEREQEDRTVESKKRQQHATSLAAIPGFGFFVIGLVCLYHLLNAL